MFKNWKTTLAGLAAGAVQISTAAVNAGQHVGHVGTSDWLQIIAGIGTIFLGALAKDHNVTGGTKQQ